MFLTFFVISYFPLFFCGTREKKELDRKGKKDRGKEKNKRHIWNRKLYILPEHSR